MIGKNGKLHIFNKLGTVRYGNVNEKFIKYKLGIDR